MRHERLMVQASVTQIVQRKSTLSIIVRYVWGCFTTRIKGVFNPTAMPVFYYLPATYCSQGSTRVHTFKLPLRFSSKMRRVIPTSSWVIFKRTVRFFTRATSSELGLHLLLPLPTHHAFHMLHIRFPKRQRQFWTYIWEFRRCGWECKSAGDIDRPHRFLSIPIHRDGYSPVINTGPRNGTTPSLRPLHTRD